MYCSGSRSGLNQGRESLGRRRTRDVFAAESVRRRIRVRQLIAGLIDIFAEALTDNPCVVQAAEGLSDES